MQESSKEPSGSTCCWPSGRPAGAYPCSKKPSGSTCSWPGGRPAGTALCKKAARNPRARLAVGRQGGPQAHTLAARSPEARLAVVLFGSVQALPITIRSGLNHHCASCLQVASSASCLMIYPEYMYKIFLSRHVYIEICSYIVLIRSRYIHLYIYKCR